MIGASKEDRTLCVFGECVHSPVLGQLWLLEAVDLFPGRSYERELIRCHADNRTIFEVPFEGGLRFSAADVKPEARKGRDCIEEGAWMFCEWVEIETVDGMCCKVKYYSRDGENADIWQTLKNRHDWPGVEARGVILECCRRTEHESKEHKSC